MTVTSPDLNIFQVKVLYDLSGATPVVKITNKSSGPHLNLVKFWFSLKSASGVQYHLGSDAVPDRPAPWAFDAVYTVPEAMPQILGHIDWSGSDWTLIAYAKDSANNIFTSDPIYSTNICRPGGNKMNQKNNWGGAHLAAFMNCTSGKLFIEDKTSYSYKGLAGTAISKVMKLIFPADDTQETPEPHVENDMNSIEIAIPYSGDGFQLLLDAVYEFDYGNNTAVRFKYKFKSSCFSIQCGKELCGILCWIAKYEKELETNGCTAAEREKLLLVTSKLTRALAAIMQPLCGIDLSKIVSEIKKLIGDCGDCEGGGNGINPAGNCATPLNLEVDEPNPA